ncbi:MAG: DUF748 domain-containing protein [Bacteroidota bacterium]|nr:DUF748 domain-containing protein [Bacteroidota bacterium]
MSKLKKTLLILATAVLILIGGTILFISPITKYLIQKYDKEFTGRQITLDWAYVNPFTGYIYLSNLKVYELNSDTIFLSSTGVSANFAMLKMFYNTYEINKISLKHPKGIVIQNELKFNFDDLIEKFTSTSDPDKEPLHFNILNMEIIDGEFYYIDKITPISYFIKQVNIESSGKRWDVDTIAANFSFLPGIGKGDIKGNCNIDVQTKEYSLEVLANKYDLEFIGQYLKDLTNYGSFSANLDTDIKINGNFNDGKNISAKGMIAFNDFHFGKTTKDDYAAFENLVISIDELSPINHIYFYDSIILNKPFFVYELYDYLDNMQTMFGVKGSKIESTVKDDVKFNLVIEIAKYIKMISTNFLQSHYKIGKLAIYNGDIKYNDYTLGEKFAIELNPLTIISDSIDTDKRRVNVRVESEIIPYGNFTGNLSINPKDSSDFDLNYHLGKLPLAMFNPYAIAYTSFPLNRGSMEFNGKWHVREGNIQSENHLVISDLRTSSRLKNKNTRYIPVPLILAFVRDEGNVIDYEIPINGDLKNPKFKLTDVFMDLLENIFVKPPTTPYRMKIKKIETEIEKSFALNWQTRQSAFLSDQEKFIETLVKFLVKNPGETITVHPQDFKQKEKEYILFFEAKKKYFLSKNIKKADSFSENDSLKVDKSSIKDSLFVNYLNSQLKDSLLFTVQDKCAKLIGWDVVNTKYEQLIKKRQEAFLYFFKEKEVEKQLKFSEAKNTFPYNGFSFYKIEYKTEFPESLINAYQKMNEINVKENLKKSSN